MTQPQTQAVEREDRAHIGNEAAGDAVDVIAAARALAPRFRESAVQVDRDRAIPREHYEALRDARLFDILKPKKYGGLELSVHEHAMVTLEMAAACASTAWVYSILAGDNLIILGFPEEAQDEIWGANRHATLAGSTFLNSKSKATRVEGGYRLSGTWGFNSGSDFSEWLVLSALVDDGDQPFAFLVPKGETSTIDDWFPTGMRGTGSRTIVTDDIFVPDRRGMPAMEVFTRDDRKALHPTFHAIRTPLGGYGKFGFSAVALGAANSAVQHFIETAASSTRVATALGGQLRLIEQDYVASEFADVSGEVAMATLLVEEKSRRAAEQIRRGDTISPQQLAENFLQDAQVTRIAVRAVQRIAALIGSKTGFVDHPVSRAKRDAEMVAHHVTLNWRQAAVQYTSAVCDPSSARAATLPRPR